MYKFSKRSLDNLVGVHPDLVRVVHIVMDLQIMDFTVIDGLRTKEQQADLYAHGKSKTMNSKHLKQADGFGHAVDICPYPIDFSDTGRFYILNGIMRAVAKSEGVALRTGADWDNDGKVSDQTFHDLPHYELEDY